MAAQRLADHDPGAPDDADPGDALPDGWARAEFGDLDLGDSRRTARLIDLATTLAQRPAAALPQACQSPARLQATYRAFKNDAITPDALYQGHRQATYARLAALPLVLAVNDTTLLDYTAHPHTSGLGPLSTAQQQGLLLHGTLAVTPDGLPVGLLDANVWVRDATTFAQLPDQHTRPIAEKESYKWLQSLSAAVAARAQCPDTQLLCVGDREADVYDLFLAERPAGVELLVRARGNRRAAGADPSLYQAAAQAPVLATSQVRLRTRPGQPQRTATLAVQAASVTLRPPKSRTAEGLAPVKLWLVQAREEHAPAGVTPLHWLLLTSVPVRTAEDALACLAWYGRRWVIESWHKVLKSGCAVERRQLQTADRLQRCLALYAVIAWRLLYATYLARVAPAVPCTVLLAEVEWQALYCRIHRTAQLPPAPPSLRQAVRWLAQLGGFLGRKGDGEPGATTLWRGYQELAALTSMYVILRPAPESHPELPTTH